MSTDCIALFDARSTGPREPPSTMPWLLRFSSRPSSERRLPHRGRRSPRSSRTKTLGAMFTADADFVNVGAQHWRIRPRGFPAEQKRRRTATRGYYLDMATARDRMLEALKELPEDASYEEAIERLVFLAKIEAGLAEHDEGKNVSHEQVKARFLS